MKSSHIHIQQGGSSAEVYVHIHATKRESDACRASCTKAAHPVSADIVIAGEVSTQTAELLDQITKSTAHLVLGYSEIP